MPFSYCLRGWQIHTLHSYACISFCNIVQIKSSILPTYCLKGVGRFILYLFLHTAEVDERDVRIAVWAYTTKVRLNRPGGEESEMPWGKIPQITYPQMPDSYCCEAAEGHRRPATHSVTNPFRKAEEEQRKAQEEMERPRFGGFWR